MMVLRLVEQGKLDLDRDIDGYLKSWKVPPSAFTAEKKVTLRFLLTHRSGFNRPSKGFGWETGKTPTLVQVLKGESPATSEPAALEFVPGDHWQYSNLGYAVIQQVLEDVTGTPFAQLAKTLLFDPLGMKDSTMGAPSDASPRARWVAPHDENGEAREHRMVPGALAHGGLVTTPTDLAKLTEDLLAGAKGRPSKVLTMPSVQLMLTKVIDIPIFGPGPFGQGTGVMLAGAGEDQYFLFPGSNAPGSCCWLIACPRTGQGALLMANGAGGEALLLELIASIANQCAWPEIK